MSDITTRVAQPMRELWRLLDGEEEIVEGDKTLFAPDKQPLPAEVAELVAAAKDSSSIANAAFNEGRMSALGVAIDESGIRVEEYRLAYEGFEARIRRAIAAVEKQQLRKRCEVWNSGRRCGLDESHPGLHDFESDKQQSTNQCPKGGDAYEAGAYRPDQHETTPGSVSAGPASIDDCIGAIAARVNTLEEREASNIAHAIKRIQKLEQKPASIEALAARVKKCEENHFAIEVAVNDTILRVAKLEEKP